MHMSSKFKIDASIIGKLFENDFFYRAFVNFVDFSRFCSFDIGHIWSSLSERQIKTNGLIYLLVLNVDRRRVDELDATN